MTHTGQESQGCASGSVSHTYVLSKSASWAAVKSTLSWGLSQSTFIHVTVGSKWVGKFRRRWNGSSAAECRKLWRGRPPAAEQRKPRYRFNYDSLIMGRWMQTSFSLVWSTCSLHGLTLEGDCFYMVLHYSTNSPYCCYPLTISLAQQILCGVAGVLSEIGF